MQEILFGYKLNPTTWAYVSALMMIGIYFKFHRFWSVRNLDLVALIALSPGLLLLYHGLLRQSPELMKTWGIVAADPAHLRDVSTNLIRAGYLWLFAVSGFFFIRLLLDPIMVRRPLLEPNLSASGLTFTGAALLVFLMANVITCPPERLEYLMAKQGPSETRTPGYVPFYKFAELADKTMVPNDPARPEVHRVSPMLAAQTHAATILAHLALVAGLIWVGLRHFDNIHTGVAASTLYLLTFSTSQLTSQVDHVIPAMLLLWAIAAYRRPLVAGLLLGTAAGLIFYPLFLLPLWFGFYWWRGAVRFGAGVIIGLALLVGGLAFFSPEMGSFGENLRLMFGWRNPFAVKPTGIWQFWHDEYRIPVFTLFAVISAGLALWPPHKNLGTLLSCSAAVMLGTQFWHADQGGLCITWYLPLLILTIFRPNLEDRVALSAVRPAWGRRRKA
ncbi:MAG: hypothetical protein LLG00_04490 [Planctomycetaceae bacterium]|nr:hypothetical protein [Planctomycetaceae bacterium]